MAEENTTPAVDSEDFAQFKAAVENYGKEPTETKEPEGDKKVEGVVDNNDASGDDDAAKQAANEAAKQAAAAAAKKGKTVQQRIAEFRRQTTEAEEVAAIEAGERLRLENQNKELLARLEALEKGGKGDKKTTGFNNEPLTLSDGRPNPGAYEFGVLDPDYDAAKDSYLRNSIKAELEEVQKTTNETAAQKAQREAVQAQFNAVLEKGLDKHDDYLQVVVQGAKDAKYRLTPLSAQLILDSEVGHDIAYHLASNPDEAAEIADLSPGKQALAIGRLEARFAAEASSEPVNDDGEDDDADGAQIVEKPLPKTVSKAPAPPAKHQTRGQGGEFSAKPDTTNFAAYKALVAKHQQGK